MSKSKLKSVYFSIHALMKQYQHEFSYATMAGRTERLKAMMKTLHELGFEPTHVKRLKAKHIEILVKHWQSQSLSVASIKNRMADLRFACQAFHRNDVVKSNDAYEIGTRNYSSLGNKAIYQIDVNKIADPWVQCAVELQRCFGLRREEALKIRPHLADQGTLLHLKGSWTKGGIPRSIPIQTMVQRDALAKAKQLAGKSDSLIPNDKTYIQQRRYYDRMIQQAGYKNLHGLRHAYAQKRYRDLTGWDAPIQGGPKSFQLNKQQKVIDRMGRKTIALELGHSRIAIVKIYCA